MKRILFVIQDASSWAGTERVLNLVASALVGHQTVGILSLAPERPCVYPYPKEVSLDWSPLTGSLLRDNLALARKIRSLGPDLVILTGLGEVKYMVAALALRSWGFLAWEHFNAAYTYRRLNRRLVARTADVVIALTERDAEDWRRLLRPRGRVVAQANPVPSFPATLAGLDNPRILAVGRLEAQKRFDLLITAFAQVAESLPGWTLRLRGSGSQEQALREAADQAGIGGRVEILPPTQDMAREYQEASIYAMSSRFEGFPMVLLEAMAAGLPCVSVDCPNGPREIIRDGEDGYVTPFGEAGPLGQALARLALDPGLRKGMGKAARRNIRRYDMASVTAQWLALLEDL